MGVKIDSRKVRAGEKWIFRKTTNMTAGARPLRWVGSYTLPPGNTWKYIISKGVRGLVPEAEAFFVNLDVQKRKFVTFYLEI